MEKSIRMIFAVALSLPLSTDTHFIILPLLSVGMSIFDIVTGILQAKINKNILSEAGTKGVWKKLSLFFALLFGYFLDVVQYFLFDLIQDSLQLSTNFRIPFGTIIGLYIILSESISICENLYKCGVRLPKFIVDSLKISREKLDNYKNKEEDNKIE